MNLLLKRKKVNLQWISIWFKFRNYKTRWIPRFQSILWTWNGKQSQSAYEYSRCLPAAWYTELNGYLRKRFWNSTCTEWTFSSFLWKFKKYGIVFLLIEANSRIQCDTENYVPIVVPGLSTCSSSSSAFIVTAGHVWWFFIKSSDNTKWQCKHSGIGKPVASSHKNEKTKIKMGHRSGIGKPVARLARVVTGVHRNSRRLKSVIIKGHTRKHFSWFWFGTSYKCGMKEAQYFYSLPERPKLRNAHWWSSTSSRKVWCLDFGRSQSPQRGWWISKQPPPRGRGTRFWPLNGYNLTRAEPNFSGDGKEFKKVFRVVAEGKSYWNERFIRTVRPVKFRHSGVAARTQRKSRRMTEFLNTGPTTKSII